jgi:hypothetical protein
LRCRSTRTPSLAEFDRPKLDALLQEVRAKSPAVVGMLNELAKEAGGREAKEKVALPPEKFEVLVEPVIPLCGGVGQ